jgi:hypothetical protein
MGFITKEEIGMILYQAGFYIILSAIALLVLGILFYLGGH